MCPYWLRQKGMPFFLKAERAEMKMMKMVFLLYSRQPITVRPYSLAPSHIFLSCLHQSWACQEAWRVLIALLPGAGCRESNKRLPSMRKTLLHNLQHHKNKIKRMLKKKRKNSHWIVVYAFFLLMSLVMGTLTMNLTLAEEKNSSPP